MVATEEESSMIKTRILVGCALIGLAAALAFLVWPHTRCLAETITWDGVGLLMGAGMALLWPWPKDTSCPG